MPDNPNTDNPPIDVEAWGIAFKPYGAYPNAAFDLARQLMAVKQLLQTQPPNVRGAAKALDDACDALFPLSEFHSAGYDLYRVAVERRNTPEHESLMDSLGIKY